MAWLGPVVGAGASLLGAKKQADAQSQAMNDSPFNHLTPEQQAMYSSIAKAINDQLSNPAQYTGQLSVGNGGLTDTETAYKNLLMGDLNSSQGLSQSVKDAMFGNLTRTLNQDVQNQIAASDADMIRRGFGLNAGESLNQMNAINRNRNQALTDAGRQVEMYADQVGRQQRNTLMDRLFNFGGYERGNQQSAFDRAYGNWMNQQAARNNAIGNAMGFAGLNSGMASTAYAGRQDALNNQSKAYGNLGAWGAQQLQPYWKQWLFNRRPGVQATVGSWGTQPNDETAYMGTW